MRIDLGGIAKGYSVDRGIEILQKQGITRAMVNAGGDTRIIGDRFGKPWVVGVRDPDHEGKIFLRLPLTDTAFSTSGDYERYFDEDGKRFHHIIDPKTGDSARKCRSVTIISGNGHAHRCADQERVHHGAGGGHRVHQHAAGRGRRGRGAGWQGASIRRGWRRRVQRQERGAQRVRHAIIGIDQNREGISMTARISLVIAALLIAGPAAAQSTPTQVHTSPQVEPGRLLRPAQGGLPHAVRTGDGGRRSARCSSAFMPTSIRPRRCA